MTHWSDLSLASCVRIEISNILLAIQNMHNYVTRSVTPPVKARFTVVVVVVVSVGQYFSLLLGCLSVHVSKLKQANKKVHMLLIQNNGSAARGQKASGGVWLWHYWHHRTAP